MFDEKKAAKCGKSCKGKDFKLMQIHVEETKPLRIFVCNNGTTIKPLLLNKNNRQLKLIEIINQNT